MRKKAKTSSRQINYDASTQQPLANYLSSSSTVSKGTENEFEREFGRDDPMPAIMQKLKIAGLIAGAVLLVVVVIIILV